MINRSKLPKVAIIGAGNVGSTLAYVLTIKGVVSEIVLIDLDKKKAEGEVMDLNHGLSFVSPATISAGTYSDCDNADIIVLTAGAAQRSGQSRLDLVSKNFQIFREIIPKIIKANHKSILLVATNPVDVMTYVTLKLSEFPTSQVIGSGTILDTSRLRYLLAEHLSVDPRNVHAYVIGEHGDSELPVWSLANIAGVRLKDYCPACGKEYDLSHLNEIFENVKNAAYKIIDRKGATYYAIGLGLARIIESIVKDENSILTISSYIQEYYGARDLCISIPTIINRNGIRERLKFPLDEEEIAQFKKSSSVIKETIESINI
jgi:L-lactate dehydrogenase